MLPSQDTLILDPNSLMGKQSTMSITPEISRNLEKYSCTKLLGKYCIQQTLGSGSFSKTKLGINMATGKQYAIKLLKPDIGESALKTILTEINALKVIKSHPNIITLYDYDQQYYIKKDG